MTKFMNKSFSVAISNPDYDRIFRKDKWKTLTDTPEKGTKTKTQTDTQDEMPKKS